MSNEVLRERAERTIASGAVEATIETVVKSITSDVTRLIDKTMESEQRLGNLKFRLLDITDDQKSEDGAPEPVRQDIEDLTYRLSRLDGVLSIILNHVNDLEKL